MDIEKTSILDLKGLVTEAYHSGQDSMAIRGSGIKDFVNTAAYGVAVFIDKFFDPILQIVESPMNMIAVTDGGNTYRRNIFHGYKSKDKKTPTDPVEDEQIKIAVRQCLEFLKSMGVLIAYLEEQEADDVIAYLVKALPGFKTIHTVDRDLIALSSPTCAVFRKGVVETTMTEKGVVIPPHLITLFKSVVGDSSDTYGGVAGVGPAGWTSMVDEFGEDGLEELSAWVDAGDRARIVKTATLTTNKAYQKCVQQLDVWLKMYQLAKLHPEICTGVRGNKLIEIKWTKRVPEFSRLEKVCTDNFCPDFIDRYEKYCYKATLVTRNNVQACAKEIASLLESTPVVPWDYETFDTGNVQEFKEACGGRVYVDMRNSKIAGCSFAFGPNLSRVFYISTAHKDTDNVGTNFILQLIKYIEKAGKYMAAQNIYFEATITLNQLGHELADRSTLDTKLYAHHLNENTEHGLKWLSKHYLNYTQTTYNELLTACNAASMAEITGEQVLSYGCDDSVVTGHLLHLFTVMSILEGTNEFIKNFECPVVTEFCKAHLSGVAIDVERMAELTERDRVTAETKMAYIREQLEHHCKEPAYDCVYSLVADTTDYVRVKEKTACEEKGLSPEATSQRVNAKLQEYTLNLKQDSFYKPLKAVKNFKNFTPTVAGFKKVTDILGVPELEKVSGVGFEDYLMANYDAYEPGTLQHKFMRLLGPAESGFKSMAKDLKTRSSDAYKALADFCDLVLEDAAEVTFEGTELNLGSPKQNQALFYLLLRLPIRMRTKVQQGSLRHRFRLPGSPATNKIAIAAALAEDCTGDNAWKKPVLQALQEYKAATTRAKIYWNVYPLWLKGSGDGLLHPGYNTCGTVTRRPTGSNPNLLQIAKGDVRTIFIPRGPGRVIVSVDFSSQELRLNADQCKDPTFMSAYTGAVPKDLHALTGCSIAPILLRKEEYREPLAVVYTEQGIVDYDFFKSHIDDKDALGEKTQLAKILDTSRGKGKTVNFSAQFGASAPTLSINMLSPLAEAELYLKAYNDTFPLLEVWKQKVIKAAKELGYTTTAYSSRRHVVPGINCGEQGLASRWERQAVNFNIQGTAADILKTLMMRIKKSDFFRRHDAYFIAAIYDEIVADVPVAMLHSYLNELCEHMNILPPNGTIPMVGDCSFGPNWGKQYEVGSFPSLEKVNEALDKMYKDMAPAPVEEDVDVSMFMQELYELEDEDFSV